MYNVLYREGNSSPPNKEESIMIQVELTVLKDLFYRIGTTGEYPKGDNAKLYVSLDLWQREQLATAWRKGKADREVKA